MNIAPPPASQIESTVAAAEKNVRRRIGHQRTLGRAGIGVGVLVALGLGGTGVATAFFPRFVDLQGVVKAQYAEEFVECIRDAGWDAQLLDAADAAPILAGWGADPADHRVVTNHLPQETQGVSGRAITTCQEDIAEEAGEGIMAEW